MKSVLHKNTYSCIFWFGKYLCLIRYFIEAASGTVERDEYETRAEPIVVVVFERDPDLSFPIVTRPAY